MGRWSLSLSALCTQAEAPSLVYISLYGILGMDPILIWGQVGSVVLLLLSTWELAALHATSVAHFISWRYLACSDFQSHNVDRFER